MKEEGRKEGGKRRGRGQQMRGREVEEEGRGWKAEREEEEEK